MVAVILTSGAVAKNVAPASLVCKMNGRQMGKRDKRGEPSRGLRREG